MTEPLLSVPPSIALIQIKEQFLETWAEIPRETSELLEELLSSQIVKPTDFHGLVRLRAEIQNCRRLAILYGDESKLDEAENILMIVLT